MPSPIPAALALNVVSNGTTADASPVEANFVNIQAAVNALISAFSGGVAGQLLSAADGTDVQWVNNIRYRKTTSKQVVNTVAETDLLNGEITVGAGVLGTSGILRLTAWGVGFNNNVATTSPLWKVTLGGTTVFQTNNTGGATDWGAFNAVRGWKLEVMIANTGVTNSQTANIHVVHSATLNGTNVRDLLVGHGTYSADNTQALFNIVGENDALAVDTTVAQALGLKVTLPVSSANTYMTLLGAVVEII